MCDRRSIQLPCSADSVGRGRRFLGHALGAWGFGREMPGQPPPPAGARPEARDARDALLLIASELMANAARFCHEDYLLAVDGHRDGVRLTVTDQTPAPAVLRQVTPDATSGRGLAIVAELAEEWGQRPFGSGTKDVWAEVAFPASVLSLSCTR